MSREKKNAIDKKKRKINLINANIIDYKTKDISKFKLHNLISIGDWCELSKNIYLEKKKFEYFDFYKWRNLKEKSKDTYFIIKVYEYFLEILADRLNYIHKKKETKKFWEILLSRWLFHYLQNLFSAWQIVQKIKNNFKLGSVITNQYDNYNFIPNNTQDAHWIMMYPNCIDWNNSIFNEILKFVYKDRINFQFLPKLKDRKNNYNFFNTIYYSNVINFSLNKKIFFYNFSLDKKIKILLMIKNIFLNFKLRNKNKIIDRKINYEMRDNLLLKKKDLKNKFFKFVYKDIKYRLPKIFLENFKDLDDTYRVLNWPKKPEYILSSYAQYYDEVFKYYCAKKIKKSKLLILQHGRGNIFADKDFYTYYMDKKISKHFLTWGKNTYGNSKPFVFPMKSLIKNKISLNKKIIFIIYAFNEKPYYPINGFINGNQKNIKIIRLVESFMNNSKPQIKKNSCAKLLSNSIVDSVKRSIEFKFPNLRFIDTKKNYSQVINKFNISIHFFLGTPFLESMHHNKPCILILDREIHLNFDKNFSSVIKDLKKNKICFEKIDEATNFMNKNYDDIISWWGKNNVQKSREKFCEKYCRRFDQNKNVLKKLFKN